MACTSLEEFVRVHEAQIKAIGFPSSLVSDLYDELTSEGRRSELLQDCFSIRKVANSRPTLIAKRALTKYGCFFVIEHIWTNDGGSKCLTQLRKSPNLAENISSLLNIPQQGSTDDCFCLDAQVDAVQLATNCSRERAKRVLEKHDGCTIQATQAVLDFPDGNEEENRPNSQANINEISFEEFKEGLKANGDMPENANDQFLHKMYHNFHRQRDGCGTTRAYNWEDEDEIITVYVPIANSVHKNAIKSTLSCTHWTLKVDGKQLLDGDLHAGVKVDDSYWSIEAPGMFCMTLEKILGDTWPALIKGEEKLTGKTIVQIGWVKRKCEDVYHDDILDTMWKYNQTYSLTSPDSQAKIPQWYVMDEIGSALQHNDYPNFKCSPFFYSGFGRAYSLIWPIKDVDAGAVCTRNFIQQIHAQETLEMCKLRLKAYTEEKVTASKKENVVSDAVEKSADVVVTELHNTVFKAPKESIKMYLGELAESLNVDTAKKLHLMVSTGSAQDSAIAIVPLKDTKISVAGEMLPSGEVFANKDYLQSYLLFRFGRARWFQFSHILPVDLVDFNKEYEKCNTLQYWLVKPVDRRITQFETFVTSQYARIVRMCETGSIAVSKYVDQLPRRQRNTTLSYPILLNMSTKNVYIHRHPAFRIAKSTFKQDDVINEYDNSASITQTFQRSNGGAAAVMQQFEDEMDEFKVQMNKLLLPKDPEKGWAYVESGIFQALGKLGKGILTDISTSILPPTNTFVLFNAEVIVGLDLVPRVVDIVSSGILPNKSSLMDILKIGLGTERSTFVKV